SNFTKRYSQSSRPLSSPESFGRLAQLSRLGKIVMIVRLYLKISSQFVEVGVDRLNSSTCPRWLSAARLASAPALASVVTAPVAAQTFQDHHVICRKVSHRITVDAGFVDPTLDAKQFPTPAKHFRHKWKAIEGAVFVKRRQYFFCRSNHHRVFRQV